MAGKPGGRVPGLAQFGVTVVVPRCARRSKSAYSENMMVATSPTSTSGRARTCGFTGWLACALAVLMAVFPVAAESGGSFSASTAKKSAQTAAKGKKRASQGGHAARAARTARIRQAFVASTELRPMAQQLATLRTPAAYAGVTKFAHAHTGEAAAAAYLALGHAYLVDRRFAEASENLRQARQAGQEPQNRPGVT